MNNFLNALKTETNYTYTENGGITHKTTHSALLDMFALGGSMRNRSNEDIITMFKQAYMENPEYALKCLYYLRDCRGGAGERRFFRTAINWLANEDPDAVRRNLAEIIMVGRWDDLFVLEHTRAWPEAFAMIANQLLLDMKCKTPSLAAKWMPSENTSSAVTKERAYKLRMQMGLSSRDYRKMLSTLRARINIVETLMSQNRWDEIEFDKIPSKAGLIYRNAFARNDFTRERYEAFMADKDTKVNASTLNPVDIAHQIFTSWNPDRVSINTWEKYWANLKDYYNGRAERGIAVCDVSGSMEGRPLEAAVSMSAYIAERGKGPFQNHFITFSAEPELVEFKGANLYDKFKRASNADWGSNTNIEAVFDLLLETGRKHHISNDEMPQTIYIFSDMEFDRCVNTGNPGSYSYGLHTTEESINTVIEEQIQKWTRYGYTAPRVIFWNLDARQDNIPALGDKFSYVSGSSMTALEAVLSGKDGYDLMMEMLNKERYSTIK